MLFSNFGLHEILQKNIAAAGFSVATPIQEQAIPVVLSGKDVMGAAQTGTGKTAAFVLPLLHLLLPSASKSPSPARHPLKALILSPTRELAMQIDTEVKKFSADTALRSGLVYGGVDMNKQVKELQAGVEILVATPGRLLDHLQQKNVQLRSCTFLVLDEADRMLDMGFLPDIETIIQLLATPRQTMLFSATFAPAIKDLAQKYLHQPVVIEVATANSTSSTITQTVYLLDSKTYKTDALSHLMQDSSLLPAIIFTNTKIAASRLYKHLQEQKISCGVLHGDRSQSEREQTLKDFKEEKLRVLVATDVAARGLDVAGLPCVVNYDIPTNPEDYVHRIGRTGRAGLPGKAIALMKEEDEVYLKDIETTIHLVLERQALSLPHATRPAHRTEHRTEQRNDQHHEQRPRDEQGHRSERPAYRGVKKTVVDEWFLRSYEPPPADSPEHVAATAPFDKKNRLAPPLAALLGGIPAVITENA